MLAIRLFRGGKKNQPFFKIVVTDKRKPPRGGRFVEEVGFLNPLTKEKGLKPERIKYWMSKGAKPSSTVYNLLIKEKILEGEKIPVHKKKKPSSVPLSGTSEGKEKAEEKLKETEAPVGEVKAEKTEPEETKPEEPKIQEKPEEKEEPKEAKPEETKTEEAEKETKKEEPKKEEIKPSSVPPSETTEGKEEKEQVEENKTEKEEEKKEEPKEEKSEEPKKL